MNGGSNEWFVVDPGSGLSVSGSGISSAFPIPSQPAGGKGPHHQGPDMGEAYRYREQDRI